YTLVVSNAGTAVTTGAITVTDTLPAGLTFVSGAGAGWSVVNAGQIVTASNPGPIAAPDSAQFTLTVSIAPAAFPSVTNAATVATAADLRATNNRDPDPTALLGLPVVPLPPSPTPFPYPTLFRSYTLVVSNPGTAATAGATTVTDTLPAGITYVSGAGAGW